MIIFNFHNIIKFTVKTKNHNILYNKFIVYTVALTGKVTFYKVPEKHGYV